jgi:hypothetical protein
LILYSPDQQSPEDDCPPNARVRGNQKHSIPVGTGYFIMLEMGLARLKSLSRGR